MFDARRAAGSLFIAVVVSFLGALLLRWIDTPAVWFYAFGATVTAAAVVQAVPELSLTPGRVSSPRRIEGDRRRLIFAVLFAVIGLVISCSRLHIFPFDPAAQNSLVRGLKVVTPTVPHRQPHPAKTHSSNNDKVPSRPESPRFDQHEYAQAHAPPASTAAPPRYEEYEEAWDETEGEFEEEDWGESEGGSGEVLNKQSHEPRSVKSTPKNDSKSTTRAAQSGSSPLVPILVAIFVLGGISVAAVLGRQRRHEGSQSRTRRGNS